MQYIRKSNKELYKTIIIILLFLVSARLSFSGDSNILVLPWLIIWCSIFFLVKRYIISLLLMSFIFLFQQSIWYAFDYKDLLTIYEIELFNIKPIEILVFVAFLRVFFQKSGKIIAPDKQISKIIFLWLTSIIVGISTAIINQVTLYDVFIFSEFRTILLGLFFLFVIINTVEGKVVDFFSWLLFFTFIKIILSIIEYYFDLVLLWPGVAKSYAGGSDALHGGDSDIAILLFVFSLLVTQFFYSKGFLTTVIKKPASFFNLNNYQGISKFNTILLLLIIISVLLSLRRGGVLSIAIIVFFIFLLEPIQKKIIIGIISFFLITALIIDNIFNFGLSPKFVNLLLSRFLGTDEMVQMSNSGHFHDIRDVWARIKGGIIFGSGVGARLELARVQAWGIRFYLLIV